MYPYHVVVRARFSFLFSRVFMWHAVAAFALSPFVALLLCVLLLLHMMASVRYVSWLLGVTFRPCTIFHLFSKIVKTIARQGFTETLPAKLSRLVSGYQSNSHHVLTHSFLQPTAWTYLGVQFGFFVYGELPPTPHPHPTL